MNTIKDVIEKTGKSRTTIYRWMEEGNFPLPDRDGNKLVWSDAAILPYLKDNTYRIEFEGRLGYEFKRYVGLNGGDPEKLIEYMMGESLRRSMTEHKTWPVAIDALESVLGPMELEELFALFNDWKEAQQHPDDFQIIVGDERGKPIPMSFDEMSKKNTRDGGSHNFGIVKITRKK